VRRLLVALALSTTLAACESTQDKAAKLAESGSAAFTAKGLRIDKRSKDVKVGKTAVLKGPDGVAVAVELTNTTRKTLAEVPIAIDVRSAKGKSLFKNDDPGLAKPLVSVGLLRPHETLYWVHDQVFATGKPAKVKVTVGQVPPLSGEPPKIDVTPPKFEQDPVSGLSVTGKAKNESDLLQTEFTLYAVARKGGKVVAAGRGGIERFKPGKTNGWQIFFIGDPKGAKLQLAAPPTVFQ
jgi:hypothetical protein